MNNHGEILIEIDGIYCPECNALHQTLFWHEKYDDYIDESKYKERIIKANERFWTITSRKDVQKDFLDYIETLEIYKAKMSDKCVICTAKTNFKNKKTNNHVCSDECRYADNEENQ